MDLALDGRPGSHLGCGLLRDLQGVWFESELVVDGDSKPHVLVTRFPQGRCRRLSCLCTGTRFYPGRSGWPGLPPTVLGPVPCPEAYA